MSRTQRLEQQWRKVAEEARGCRNCGLWEHATQTVFGEGAVRAQAVMGPKFRVTVDRGKPLESPLAPTVIATVHPSSILRAPTPEDRHTSMDAFVADLRVAAKAVHG